MSQEWCEHCFTGPMYTTDWNFCPICGTPRPKEKSKRERLSETLWDAWWGDRPNKPLDMGDWREGYLREADAALNFLHNEDKK